MPADKEGGPYPVLIIMPGINVGPESYAWLASALAVRGIVVVTYSMIAEEMPGYISLTPGLDLAAITPETYGKTPSATAIEPVIASIRLENASGILAGCIDLSKVVLAGHSAGGSVAMYNANPDWFPEVCGALAFAAHAAASTALGFAENTVLDLPGALPIMLIGGTRDGVIESSAHRYGDGVPPNRLQQTFDEGFHSDRGDSYLVMVEGANHFSIAWPVDESSGRHFLDLDEQGDGKSIRAFLADIIEGFVLDACNVDDNSSRVSAFENHELIASFQRR
jgi:dienelactone hydrolase